MARIFCERFVGQPAQLRRGAVLHRMRHVDRGSGEAERLALSLEAFLEHRCHYIDSGKTAGIEVA